MVTIVRQRSDGDCGVAALAMLLSATHAYEDVYLAAAAVDRDRKGKDGLTQRELQAVARRLGLTVTPARRYDLGRDAGLLRVYSDAHHAFGHWVAVRYGLLWDPADGFATPWRDYALRYTARLATLLRVGD
jgi:ABC-type bacteriocin/lantibiotic exporter with double-glycine peptidase domain